MCLSAKELIREIYSRIIEENILCYCRKTFDSQRTNSDRSQCVRGILLLSFLVDERSEERIGFTMICFSLFPLLTSKRENSTIERALRSPRLLADAAEWR